jgi:probable HAF family extracellular repeat protein
MADVFLSYAREDAPRAKQISRALCDAGISVFFDTSIAIGKAWDRQIESEMAEARTVVVLWSSASCASQWVRNEARVGLHRGVLYPALIENCRIPIEFSHLQAADLRRCELRAGDPNWDELVLGIVSHGRLGQRSRGEEKAAKPTNWWRDSRRSKIVGAVVLVLAAVLLVSRYFNVANLLSSNVESSSNQDLAAKEADERPSSGDTIAANPAQDRSVVNVKKESEADYVPTLVIAGLRKSKSTGLHLFDDGTIAYASLDPAAIHIRSESGTWANYPVTFSAKDVEIRFLSSTGGASELEGELTTWVPGTPLIRRTIRWTANAGLQVVGEPLIPNLGTLGKGRMKIVARNRDGEVAGEWTDQSDHNRGFFWSPKSNDLADIGVLSSTEGRTFVEAMNDAGQVVGRSSSGSTVFAFLWSSSHIEMQNLGTLPARLDLPSYSEARAISSNGIVIGMSNWQPFIWLPASNKMYSLAGCGADIYPVDVNAAAQVLFVRADPTFTLNANVEKNDVILCSPANLP